MTDESKGYERIDLDEVQRLVNALERDLARAQRGEAELGELRGEVEQLRSALGADVVPHAQIHRGLLGLRERLHAFGDELFDDALKAGDYVGRLGRLLGL
jgi:hypothetical protein